MTSEEDRSELMTPNVKLCTTPSSLDQAYTKDLLNPLFHQPYVLSLATSSFIYIPKIPSTSSIMLFSSYLVSAATAFLLIVPVSIAARPTNDFEIRATSPNAAVAAALAPIQSVLDTFRSEIAAKQYSPALTTLNNALETSKAKITAIPKPTKRDIAPRQTNDIGALLNSLVNDILADIRPVLNAISLGLIPGLDILLNDILIALEVILDGVKALLPSVIALVEELLGAVGALLSQL
ncbi:hypothetical protein FRB95_001333 [Tulasnella sp. JGI-2019a]|nr:hypothetical protein FRB93_006528 [Tulasnella sp. JGI-2019a]KAG9038476.1 hypothetical protein FRB95_001333 [Tulasnella sp. JGI-2019a]